MPHKDPTIARKYFAKYHEEHRDKLCADARKRYAKNPERALAASKKWALAHPERRKQIARESYHRRKEAYRSYRRHYRTGCDQETYDRLWLEQGGVCAICKSPPFKPTLDADHDHKTAVIRGLLCNRCNTALGNLQDSPDLLRAAIAYLEKVR